MYLILFDNGTSASIPLDDMASLIPSPPVLGDALSTPSTNDDSSLLLPFLQIGSRITYEHVREYHKGFLTRNTSGTYRFSFKHILRKSLKTGVWTFPTCLSLGLTYAQRVFCSRAMLLIHSFVHHQTIIALLLRHHSLSPLTPWQTL